MESATRILEAMVIAIREGIEASLVVGLVLAFLQRSGRAELKRYVWSGVVLASLFSLLAACSLQLLGVDADNDLAEGITMTVAGLMVGSLVFYMWRAGKDAPGRMNSRLASISSQRRSAWQTGVPMLLFVFFMVGREGIETVLFLLALGGTAMENPAYNVIGGLLGIGLAAIFGLLLFRGSIRVNLRTFFSVTGIVLLILVFKLLAGGIHGFSEAGLFSLDPTVMSIIGWLVKDDTSSYILMALIGLPALIVLKGALSVRTAAPSAPSAGLSNAERRKQAAQAGRTRRLGFGAAAVGFAIVLALGAATAAIAASRYDPDPQPVNGEDGLQIPTFELTDGLIHKYSYQTDSATIRVMLVFDGQNYMAAYDTCEVCPAKGFMQEDDNKLICKNCNAPVDINTLPDGGGCNPIPLPLAVKDDTVIVSGADLVADPEAMSKFGNA